MTDLSTVMTIPAGSLVTSTYRITCGGYGTQGTTLQNLTFGFYTGGTQAGSNITVGAGTWNAISDAFRWRAEATIVVVSTGVSGSLFGSMYGHVTDTTVPSVNASNNTTGFADANRGAVTIDTTSPQTFSIKAAWAATTGAPTITCTHTLFERRLGAWP